MYLGRKNSQDILRRNIQQSKEKSNTNIRFNFRIKTFNQDIGDATLIVPLIKEYMDIGVRNDEQLIKMATIVQRALNNSTSEDAMGITEEEKAAINGRVR